MKYAWRRRCGVIDVMVIGGGVMVFGKRSLSMFVVDSMGPGVIKEKRGRQRREEEMNCQLK